ncbi:MAG: hypothetical protein U9M89_02390 [Patescibacteria group bacterium]|nr:hypothetical protein [Patescibacteria group bacterium]
MEDETNEVSAEEIVQQEEIIIEKEWQRITKLMSQKNKAAVNMAVVEADKLFREVLGVMSHGETVNEAIANTSKMFSDLKSLLEVRKVYEDVVEVPGYFVDQETAKKAAEIYLKAILDMMGRDMAPRSGWQRFWNDIVYFGGSRPTLLRDILVGILAFFAMVWFLHDTVYGQMVVGASIGITHFVLQELWWLVIVLVVVLLISLVSWLFSSKKR